MIFAHPIWLMALPVLAGGAAWLWRVAQNSSRRRIAKFLSPGSAALSVPPVNRRLRLVRFGLPALILALIALALARPLTGPKPGATERIGVDMVVALDVSKSMWAEDIPPNRLEAVKSALAEWLHASAGDRVGLVVFAGEALIQAPVTHDFQTLGRILQLAGPKVISKGGTDIPKAVSMASRILEKGDLDTKVLLLITDGENLEGDALAAVREAHEKNGITTFAVGVGTPAGERVPQVDRAEFDKLPPDKRKQRAYMRNEYGTEVVSRLDEPALRAIAAAGAGSYRRFEPRRGFFKNFRETVLLPMTKERERKVINPNDYHEWFQVAIGAAILLMVLEPLIPVHRTRGVEGGVGVSVTRPDTLSQSGGAPLAFRGRRKGGAAVLSILFACGIVLARGAVPDIHAKLDEAIRAKKFDEAVAMAREQANKWPLDSAVQYDLGLTLYRAGRFEEAIEVFQRLTTASESAALRERALFQIGNSQFRLGERLGTQPSAVLAFERSLSSYEESLQLHSTKDSKHNRDAAREALKMLLQKFAADRLKAAEEFENKNDLPPLIRALQEALDVQERLVTLEPEDKEIAADRDNTRQRLEEALLKEASQQAAETDEIENQNNPKRDREVLGRREQTIAMLDRAQALAPKDPRPADAAREERAKMSNLMTRRAEEKLAPVFQKPKLGGGELDLLNKARPELAKAIELDPSNVRAKEMKEKAEAILENHYLPKAEKALEEAQKPKDPRQRLQHATDAVDLFAKTEEINPESARAKEGKQKAEAMLPELHAAAAAVGLQEARKLLNESKAEDSLKKAVGHLESSAQHYARAEALKPGDASIRKGLEEARDLLAASRDALNEQRDKNPEADAQEIDTNRPSNHKPAKIYLQNQHSPQVSPPTSGFWNRTNRDW